MKLDTITTKLATGLVALTMNGCAMFGGLVNSKPNLRSQFNDGQVTKINDNTYLSTACWDNEDKVVAYETTIGHARIHVFDYINGPNKPGSMSTSHEIVKEVWDGRTQCTTLKFIVYED